MGPVGHPRVPDAVLAKLRLVCTGLPEAREEPAWTGIRWCVLAPKKLPRADRSAVRLSSHLVRRARRTAAPRRVPTGGESFR
jgi:hypothetical protein